MQLLYICPQTDLFWITI